MEKLILGEDSICPITKKHCDDECCPVGAECNMSNTEAISEVVYRVDIKKELLDLLNKLKQRESDDSNIGCIHSNYQMQLSIMDRISQY